MVRVVASLLLSAFVLFSVPLLAQSNRYLRLKGYPQQGYIEIPATELLDTPQMTVEAWVFARDARQNGGCSSLAGNGYLTGWWLGLCGTTMRSYFNGSSSVRSGGIIPVPDAPPTWIHIAAVTDGTTRKHYIDGNLVLEMSEAPLSASQKSLRIGSDPDWDFMAQGGIDDLRIWRVARTQEQIRRTMFSHYILEANDVLGEFTSLEAWYRFEGNAMDSWRTHHGTIIGTGTDFQTGVVFTPPRRRAASH
jgi:hypothetical protein